MVGHGWEIVGIIQPMCSAPGAFPPGAFFRQKSAPFPKKCIFLCFYDKTSLFIIKRPDPGPQTVPTIPDRSLPCPQAVASTQGECRISI